MSAWLVQGAFGRLYSPCVPCSGYFCTPGCSPRVYLLPPQLPTRQHHSLHIRLGCCKGSNVTHLGFWVSFCHCWAWWLLCVCVCVCVSEREREIGQEKEPDCMHELCRTFFVCTTVIFWKSLRGSEVSWGQIFPPWHYKNSHYSMENHSLPLGHTTSVLGSARNRCWGNCAHVCVCGEGIFMGNQLRPHVRNRLIGIQARAVTASHTVLTAYTFLFCCHGGGPRREFPRRQRRTCLASREPSTSPGPPESVQPRLTFCSIFRFSDPFVRV